MKELTTEQKAKRYDEAIKIAKEINNEQRAQPFNVMTKVFPELAESEDEQIRKALLRFHKSTIDIDGIKGEDILAWLEKQGEQKSIDNFTQQEAMDIAVAKCFDEQKPAEEYHITGIKSKNAEGKLGEMIEKIEHNPAWSKEDEKCIKLSTDIIDSALRAGFCVQLDRDRCTDWLKSLKERMQPQNHWKPSEEQMKVLDEVIRNPRLSTTEYNGLIGLMEQFKKLKE